MPSEMLLRQDLPTRRVFGCRHTVSNVERQPTRSIFFERTKRLGYFQKRKHCISRVKCARLMASMTGAARLIASMTADASALPRPGWQHHA